MPKQFLEAESARTCSNIGSSAKGRIGEAADRVELDLRVSGRIVPGPEPSLPQGSI